MSSFAKEIVVEQSAARSSLRIDGKEFPWYLTEAGVQPAPAKRAELPGVTITIPADRVEFVHDLKTKPVPKAKLRQRIRWALRTLRGKR